MPKLSLDFTGVGTTVPEGQYDAELKTLKTGESQQGNPMLNFRYQIISGDYEGRTLFDNIPLMETTFWRLRLALVGLGIDPGSMGGAFELDTDDLLGRKTRVTVAHRQYQGEVRANITRFDPISGVEALALDSGLAEVNAEELEEELDELFG